MTKHDLGHRHLHVLEPVCRRTALRVVRRTPLNPPALSWAVLFGVRS